MDFKLFFEKNAFYQKMSSKCPWNVGSTLEDIMRVSKQKRFKPGSGGALQHGNKPEIIGLF